MADDPSYATFLAKVNQDPSSETNSSLNQSTAQARSKFDPTEQPNSSAPPQLQHLDVTYTSDTDAAFEPCFFSYAATSLPTVEDFKHCLKAKGNETKVEELSVEDFDPRGEYKEVLDKVEEVGEGKGVKIFRVEVDRTRVEYYVVTVGERKLIGVVAKAVES